jgi:hypothetical protein
LWLGGSIAIMMGQLPNLNPWFQLWEWAASGCDGGRGFVDAGVLDWPKVTKL